MKKIVVPVVNRTNYSKLRPILELLKSNEAIQIDVIIASGAMIGDYGTIKREVEADGFMPIYMDTCMKSDRHEAMSKNVALSLAQYSTYIRNQRPDFAIIVGDRFDMIGFAISSAFQNIPIAHIQGGEKSGTIDNKVRFAITCLADYHFVATESAFARVCGCGVSANRVFNYGCPAVEGVVKHSHKEPERSDEYLLVQVHPNTVDIEDVKMEEVIEAIKQLDIEAIVMHPNIDATNHSIYNVLSTIDNDKIECHKHFPMEKFFALMRGCSCFIGNSSAIIRESASFGIPAINLGTRQVFRDRNKNTFDCSFDAKEIVDLYLKIKDREFVKENMYYKENSAKNIAEKIEEVIGV